MQNYRGISGFRLNNQEFSAHDHEQEFLLMEGLQVFVIKVEDVKIDFSHHSSLQLTREKSEVPGSKRHLNEENKIWSDLDGQTITFIHLFNENW